MSTMPNLPAALDAVRILSPLSDSTVHGEEHWRRVASNGLDMAEEVGADPLLVVLFGIFHDSMQFAEYSDPGHGKRGGFLACCLNTELIGLADDRLDLLYAACAGHTDGETSDDATIGVCWDADRLDLCRLDEHVNPGMMSTATGRTIRAQARAEALLTDTPDWASIFRRLDARVRGVSEVAAPVVARPVVAPPRPEPQLVENRRIPVQPVEGHHYWTATLLNAPEPVDETARAATGDENRRAP